MLSQMGQPPVGQWSVGEDWLKQHWEMTCSTFKLQMGEILKEPSRQADSGYGRPHPRSIGIYT